MKKVFNQIILLLFTAAFLVQARPGGKTSVAVYPIKAVGAVDKSLAATMTSLLGYELSQSPKLIYIRDDLLKTVMERQAQNISDACDSTMCQVSVGKLVQAQKMVVGDISKLGSLYILTVNLVDVESGAIENTFKEKCSCSEDQLEQLASAAGNKIREHYGESGLTVQTPPAPAEAPAKGQALVPVQPSKGKGLGSLTITTEPAGVDIYLDAELKGKTPMTITNLPTGSHSLSLMKQGYSSLMKEVVLTANAAFPVSERLLKETGALEIRTVPKVAQIYLDGKYIGDSPKKLEGLACGPHSLKALAENYQAAEKKVEVGYQQTTQVSLELSGMPGKILIASVPEGAEVRIDGEKKGVTTYIVSLAPGKHRVKVSREGYETADEEVDIFPNKAVSKNYVLQKSSGLVTGKKDVAPEKKNRPMVLVPAGDFWMGCNEKVDRPCGKDVYPYHQVYLDAFKIDKYEVTQEEYNECMWAGKCKGNNKYDGLGSLRQPVVGVDWNDAKNYCEWVGKRLPTEAEWEKAARGTDGRRYPWGNQDAGCEFANFADCNMKKTLPGGSMPAGVSPYGAMDMAGNAWEWVADWYGDSYYEESPNKNPTGPGSGTSRVLRGGGWNNYQSSLRASKRSGMAPNGVDFDWGFRCAGE